jgi:hypothetical protein
MRDWLIVGKIKPPVDRDWLIVARKSGKSKGGHARAAALSAERRREIAKKAAHTRWRRK